MLLAAGHQLEIHNLLTTPWTVTSLRRFFGDRPVREWFNATAPRIKSKEVEPEKLDEETALQLMVEDPILIRRLLIQVGQECRQGFDGETIASWIGLNIAPKEDLENCPRHNDRTKTLP